MIRVGLAGLGFMGGTHAQCYAALPNAELVAVADPDADRQKQFADMYGAKPYASLEQVLSAGVDMVDICLPTFLHRPSVEAAAAAGKHILCEKPMALSAPACDAMIAAVRKAGVQLMIAHVIRFWPDYMVIKQTIDSGRLGKPRWASATRLSPSPAWSWDGWIVDPKRAGGAVLDLHIHDLDCLAWLLGMPKAVFAGGVKAKSGALNNVWTTTMGHAGGAVGFAEASNEMAVDFPFTMGLKVGLEGGTIEFNSRLTPSLLVAPGAGTVEHPEAPQPKVETAGSAGPAGNIEALGGYFNEIQYFANCLERGETPDRVTPQEARNAVALCLAAEKSAETGQAVGV